MCGETTWGVKNEDHHCPSEKIPIVAGFLGCFLTATGGRITAGEPVLPAELNYVNLELQEIFRDLAETGEVPGAFAHPLQKRATMIIAAGSPVKKLSAILPPTTG